VRLELGEAGALARRAILQCKRSSLVLFAGALCGISGWCDGIMGCIGGILG
jgi:hypothetical protein